MDFNYSIWLEEVGKEVCVRQDKIYRIVGTLLLEVLITNDVFAVCKSLWAYLSCKFL